MTTETTNYPGVEYTGSNPKYPDIQIPLVQVDGNSFAVIGRVQRAMRRAGVPTADINAFRAECTAGDYDHLLQTVMATVSIG